MATKTSRKYKSSIRQALTLHGVYTINNLKTIIQLFQEKHKIELSKSIKIMDQRCKVILTWCAWQNKHLFSNTLVYESTLTSQKQLCTTEAQHNLVVQDVNNTQIQHKTDIQIQQHCSCTNYSIFHFFCTAINTLVTLCSLRALRHSEMYF